MSKLEIACIIIGFIMFFNSTSLEGKWPDKSVRYFMIKDIISRIICGLMILLPIYFRYWK